MSKIDFIKAPVSKEFQLFEKYYEQSFKNENTLLKLITNHIYRRKGKQLRPVFVLLTAKLTGEITEKTYVGATLIELLHTATLIHDDVVDNSDYRRGFASVKALWNSKAAVLVGDYLLSKGLLISIEKDATDLLKITSEAVKEMSEGELLQIEKNRKKIITKEEYFEIISKKTAALLSASGGIGAKSAGSTEVEVERMKLLGKYIGMAFQIKDDILDINGENTGKSFGNDIREGKKTLPFILAYENCDKKALKNAVLKKLKSKEKTRNEIAEIIKFIKENNGILLAEEYMEKYKRKAEEIILYYDKKEETKKALREFIYFTIDRKK